MKHLFNFMNVVLVLFCYTLYLLGKIGFESFVVVGLVLNALIGLNNTPKDKGEPK